MSTKVTIELTADEALVLFEWLARSSAEEGPASFVNQAEQRVLGTIQTFLERQLVAPFDPRYDELLAAARSNLADDET